MNLYDAIANGIDKNPNKAALKYHGATISYQKLGGMIDSVASGLYNIGVRPNDVVGMCLPSSPESIAVTYALNKIGAMSIAIDVRCTPEQIVSIANEMKSKVLFVLESCANGILSVSEKLSANTVVVLRGSEYFQDIIPSCYISSMTLDEPFDTCNSANRIIRWNDFLPDDVIMIESYSWEPDSPQMLFRSLEMKGEAMSVVLMTRHISQSVSELYDVMNDVEETDIVLSIIPIFSYYGFIPTIHLPLSHGLCSVLMPIWKSKDYIKTLVKVKPQHVFSISSDWDTISRYSDVKLDLSFLKTIVVPRDTISEEFECHINSILNKSGCAKNIIRKANNPEYN